MGPSSSSCFPDDRDACHACTRDSSARKATLKQSSAWSQGSSNPRKHDGANGEDAFVTRSPVWSEQVGAANSWIRRISSVPTTTVPNARTSARGIDPAGHRLARGPGEAEPDQAEAPQDDRAVHEGFEVVAP